MRLLLEAEIVAHGVFDPAIAESRLSIPESSIELVLRNQDVELGSERPLLEALLMFESERLETGFEEGKRLLFELLHSLSYVTSLTFEFHRAKRLIDWSDGVFERTYYVFQDFPGHDLPHYALDPDLIKSAGAIWQASKGHPLQVAVHWFASGVKAKVAEDQFQLFWLAAELCATFGKNADKVNDLCAICRSPLYCTACDEYPKHRPYNKQAIEQMIHGIVGEGADEASKRLFEVRNLLMHGSTREQIEAEIDADFSDSVEDIAQIAKQAIFALLKKPLGTVIDKAKFTMLLLEGYPHKILTTHVTMVSESMPPEVAKLDRLALPSITMTVREDAADDKGHQDSA